ISFRILMIIALLRRLPDYHTARKDLEFDLARHVKGYRGEKNLKYFLGMLPNEKCKIFFDLRLKVNDYIFQIDTLIIFPSYILILEVKNFSGTIFFDKYSDQFTRIYQNVESSFPNPIFQIERHQLLLEKLFKEKNIPLMPIECLVIISDPNTKITTSNDNF